MDLWERMERSKTFSSFPPFVAGVRFLDDDLCAPADAGVRAPARFAACAPSRAALPSTRPSGVLANPRATGLQPALLHDRVTGYGIVTFDKTAESITIECWPRHVDPSHADARQFEGWPITIHRDAGDGRAPLAHLPTVRVRGLEDAVVEVRAPSGALVHARRVRGTEIALPVFAPGPHVVRVGDPDRDRWLERTVLPPEWGSGEMEFDFGG